MTTPTLTSSTTPLTTQPWMVQGMRCMSCAGKVETLALAQAGVQQAAVDLLSHKVQLQVDSTFDAAAFVAALTAAGYQVALVAAKLAVSNLSCAGCARKVQQQALRVPGVVSAEVDVLAKQLHLSLSALDSDATLALLCEQLAALGYPLTPVADPLLSMADAPSDEASDAALNPEGAACAAATNTRQSAAGLAPAPSIKPTVLREYPLWQVVLGFVLSAPLLLPMLMPGEHWMLPALWQCLLAVPVQFYLGARFYRGAFYALRAGTGSMDVLIALGTSAAFGLSLWNWLGSKEQMPALYFESASVVIAFVLLGKYLEEGVKQQTQSALSALAELQPQQVRVWRDGQWQQLPLQSVQLDDRVQVKPSERIALDGEVLRGESQVDEALISGESVPLHKTIGARLVSGALNLDGVLEYRVLKLARDSRLQQLIHQVEQAQLSKAPLQQAVDTVSRYFVPAVLLIALGTLLGTAAIRGDWQAAILHAVAVLVIACPCALGLATPAALVVGMGRAAHFGILVKDASALDAASRIDTVFFDKTGTVTQGTPVLERYLLADGAPQHSLQLAASLQQHSEHPQAKAFLAAVSELLPVQQYQVLPGLGVTATIASDSAPLSASSEAPCDAPSYALGSARLVSKLGLTVPTPMQQASSFLLQQSPTPQLLAAFWLQDAVRDSAKPAVAALAAMGVQSVLLSGDQTAIVRDVAQTLGTAGYWAEQTPEQKLQHIQQAQRQGQRVAMVGDGINDAPALAQADLGVALTTGTQVAVASSGMSLLDGDLRLLVAGLAIARRTRRVIWQNLGWAFGFNLLAIPAAALGYLSPALAGAAMAMSSVLVVSNALRLRRWHPATSRPTSAPTRLLRDLFH